MEANKIRLLEFLGTTKKTFNIPVYQRNYDWKNEHCKRLFYDIENIIKNKFEIQHFMGTVVYVLSDVQPTYQEIILIDGQQRVTSITLLLKALYDAIENEETKEDILETYLINKRAPENLRVKLKPIESDELSYRNIIENKPSSNTTCNIYKNYMLFKELIENSEFKPEEIYQAMNNIELVYIKLEKDKKSENPQMIFESLNSTGLELTPGDLIRNFLLMNHSYEEQTRLYKDYWIRIEKYLTNAGISDFIRDYLTMKTGIIPKKDKVYNQFKLFANNPNNNMDEEGLLEDLLMYAEYYSWFMFCNCPNEKINQCLRQFRDLKSTTIYPTLLYIFEDCYEFKKLTVEELEKILHLFISYLFRRIICGYKTNSLSKIFASFVGSLNRTEGQGEYKKIVKILMTKQGSGKFPRDGEFKKEFIIKNLYNTRVDTYTLYQLEKYKSKECIELHDEITIEHIMPQKLSPAWRIELGDKYEEIHSKYLNTIGNLTLTGYNSNLSNKSYLDKKEIYKTSNICLNRTLDEYKTWGKENILSRAEKLYEIAKEIWFVPEEYADDINDDVIDYSIDYNIMDDLNVTGEKPKRLIISDTEYTITTSKDLFKKLSEKLFDIDNSEFEKFVQQLEFKRGDRRIVANTDEGMSSPYQITDDIFIETNLSANAIINYCRIMASCYELQDDISFMLKTKYSDR